MLLSQLVTSLLDHNSNINHFNTKGETAITIASSFGNVNVLKLLLQHSNLDLLSPENEKLFEIANGETKKCLETVREEQRGVKKRFAGTKNAYNHQNS